MSDISTNSVQASMEAKLKARFAPQALEIINESARHSGHSRHQGGVERETGATHFRLRMTSACFSGMAALARHRAVYAALAQELQSGVHALALELKAPGET